MAGEKLTPIRKYISNGVNKKSIFYLIIVIFLGFLSLILIWHFSKMPEIKEIPLPRKPTKEEIIQKQLKELETLRMETATPTEKEIKTQLKELEKLQQKQKPMSSEEIQKQLEELEKLRR